MDLTPGMCGIVEEIDDAGDAIVQWDSLGKKMENINHMVYQREGDTRKD